jgi:KDO2-lipid IV(A) lauroyltransferase
MTEVVSSASSEAGEDLRPTVRHRLEYAGFRMARFALGMAPEAWAVRLAAGVGWLAGVLIRVRRRDVDAHLALAFPDASPAWRRAVARRSYMHLGREAVMLFRLPRWSTEEIVSRVDFVGLESLRAAAAEDRGVMLLTAHLGNWEIAGACIAASGLPIDVVGKGMANRRFEADLFATRERLGMRVIDMADAPRGVLRSLGRGRLAALLGDQNAHRNGIFIPFFGRDAATPRGPAVFALRRDVPVFVGFAIRQPGWGQRYSVDARRLDFHRTGDVETDTRALLAAYHAILEEAIVSAPDQYFWQHKRWKTRPPQESVS